MSPAPHSAAPDAPAWPAPTHAPANARRLALAWALQQRAYAAMYADLALAARAASRIRALACRELPLPVGQEIGAIADWTEGTVDALQGRAAPAVARLANAGQAFEALGDVQHAAASQVPKIIALSMLGRHDEALACAQRTLAQFAALGDERSAGKVEINLGSMLALQHRHAESAAHYRRAAVRFAHVNDRQHSVMADIGLASALSWQFEFDEAERIYERADARMRAHALPMLRGVIDSSRGLLELHRGRHAPALRWLESALREFERLGPPQRLAEARMDLAAAYLALNLLPEAAALYQQAVQGCRASDAPVEQAWACAQLGVTLGKLGQHEEAQACLAEARGLFGARGRTVAAACVELRSAALSLHRGDALQALAQAQAAAAGLADAGMRGWWLEARWLTAEALVALGRDDGAWPCLEALLAYADGLPDLQACCHTACGLLLQRRGDLAGARLRLELATRLIESQQAALHSDEFRTGYGADKQTAFDALLAMALDDAGPDGSAQVLACAERARARSLALGLQALGPAAAAETPGAAAWAHWRDSLHWLQQQMQHAETAGDPTRAGTLRTRLADLEAQALEAHRREQAAGGAMAAAGLLQSTLPLAALQASLDARTALVEYARAGARWVVIVVRRDSVRHMELFPEGVDRRIEQLRFQINALRFGAAALQQHQALMVARTQAHLEALHRQLWAPVAAWLEGIDHAVVVPCGALHYVPFCALHDGRQALLEHHAVSLAPSAQVWHGTQAPAATARPALRRAVVAGMAGDSLPHVQQELQSVAAVFAAGASVLQDEALTLPALKAQLAGADLLHLACHGQFRADSPYFSALQLSDGGLTLRDAAALPLTGTMVTLSACETGLSRVAPGDELVGLVRGFLMAGAPTVMATLWTVDDAGTAALMSNFYRALIDTQPPAQALRQAQIALRKERPHPYFWAPFTLYGRA